MITEAEFSENLTAVRLEIEKACVQAGRSPDEVTLLPVTKNWPVEAVRYCHNANLTKVGENRVQEAKLKMGSINGIEWELIGHLQSNKVNQAIECFSRIQSVDSSKLLNRINHASNKRGLVTRILLQVNTGNDPAKFGVSAEDANLLMEEALKLENLKVEGLMTVAPIDSTQNICPANAFSSLRILGEKLSNEFGVPLNELSMGMSGDLKHAILEGSTVIRVGSSLFGSRKG